METSSVDDLSASQIGTHLENRAVLAILDTEQSLESALQVRVEDPANF
jgi:hypothetical protein